MPGYLSRVSAGPCIVTWPYNQRFAYTLQLDRQKQKSTFGRVILPEWPILPLSSELCDANVAARHMGDDLKLAAQGINEATQCADLHIILRFQFG